MPSRLLLGISILWIPLAFLFDGVTVLMLPLRLGGDATAVGLVSFVGLLIATGLQPLAGSLSDRVRGRVNRRVFAAVAAAPAIIGLWVLVGSSGLGAALIGYVLLQAAASTVQAGQQTFIPEYVPPEARGRASGLKAAFDVGGSFLAFLVLGATLATGDLRMAAFVTTLILAVGLGTVIGLVPGGAPSTAQGRAGSWRPPAQLWPLVAARFLFLFATFGVGRFLLLLVSERLAIPPDRAADEAGLLLALLSLATAGAALLLGSLADRVSKSALMAGGAIVGGMGIMGLIPSSGLAGLVLGGLLMAIGTAAFVTANWAATTALARAPDAGRVMGVANLGTGLAAAAAGLLGPLIDARGFVPALLVAAAASVAAVIPVAGRWSQAPQPLENRT